MRADSASYGAYLTELWLPPERVGTFVFNAVIKDWQVLRECGTLSTAVPDWACWKVPVTFTPSVEPPKKKHHIRKGILLVGGLVILAGVFAVAAEAGLRSGSDNGLSGGTSSIYSAAGTTTPAATTTTPAVTTTQLSPADAYLAVLDRTDPTFADGSQVGILNVGLDICTQLEDGYSVAEVANYSINVDNETGDGYTVIEMGYMIGAAVDHLCPAYIPEAQAYVASQGD
jgi:hypothetical protein